MQLNATQVTCQSVPTSLEILVIFFLDFFGAARDSNSHFQLHPARSSSVSTNFVLALEAGVLNDISLQDEISHLQRDFLSLEGIYVSFYLCE